MDVMEAREALRTLVASYFKSATVVYAKQSFRVKPQKPLVTLSFGSANRPLNPPTKIIDGRPVSFYPTTLQVQIDLFTLGRERKIAKGVTPVMENTAESDMLAFANFLNSEYAVQFCHNKDMAIVLLNNVQDLTDLINDTNYEYRAMLELELRFTTTAIGYSGSLDISSVTRTNPATGEVIPARTSEDIQDEGGKSAEGETVTSLSPKIVVNASGGGNAEMAADEEGYFTSVEISEE